MYVRDNRVIIKAILQPTNKNYWKTTKAWKFAIVYEIVSFVFFV